jgi:hypothetical protein
LKRSTALSAVRDRGIAVWAKLPRAGLGNKLYVWARALAFARINGGSLFVSSWTHLRLGPILRGERSWRLYLGAFRGDALRLRVRLMVLRTRRKALHDPALAPVSSEDASRLLYVFDRIGGDPTDPFVELLPHRAAIVEAFSARLTQRLRSQMAVLEAPVVGIHVRRGDFRQAGWMTPIDYFCERLRDIRAVAGRPLPAMVFSDGSDVELAPLLGMGEVRRAPPQSDVLDLVQLSMSQVIVLAGGSTFGMLAGFLSDAVLIKDPEWAYGDSREAEVNRERYEGGPDLDSANWPDLLVRNLTAIRAS